MPRSTILFFALLAMPFGVGASAREPRRLTFDGQVKTTPAFVEGGRAVVYAAQTRFNQLSLLRLPLDVAAAPRAAEKQPVPELLHPSAVTSEFAAAYSADGRTLAYVRNNGNLHVVLLIEDRDAKQTVEVDPGGGFAGIQYVTVSPDGSRVVYAFPERGGGGQQLVSIGADGQRKQALTSGDDFDSCPRFSPDGRQLAFASTRGGNFDIFVMTAEGRGAMSLTDHPGLDLHPAWSPDGRRIAYTSLRSGNYDIYITSVRQVAEPVPSDAVRFTDHPERDDYAVWHPDGRHVLTVSERDGRQDLYLWEVHSP